MNTFIKCFCGTLGVIAGIYIGFKIPWNVIDIEKKDDEKSA